MSKEESRILKVGVTGSRKGMTEAQKEAFKWLIRELKPTHFSHGDCIGADNEATNIVTDTLPKTSIICHPPQNPLLRAFNGCYHILRPVRDYLARNRDIVVESSILIGLPNEGRRGHRGGTWYTINYAERLGKLVYIIWPGGSILRPNGKIMTREEQR